MAQKVSVQYFDDLDGSPLSGKNTTVSFAFEGVNYEIDLSSENRAKLKAALAPFMKAGRKVAAAAPAAETRAPRKAKAQGRKSSAANDAAKIREWAKANGLEVSERGRISAEVRQAYLAAH